jgi:hypothetical protein
MFRVTMFSVTYRRCLYYMKSEIGHSAYTMGHDAACTFCMYVSLIWNKNYSCDPS